MLKVSNFRGGYRKGVAVVDGLQIDLRQSAVTSILGSNGAGKTSFLRGICGLLPWRTGEVELNGERLDRLAPHDIARLGVRMVSEGRGTFPTLTVEENLKVGGYGLSAPVLATRMEREFNRFPRLYERRGQIAGMMSGGEQQMLAIARAMMSDPRVLILDEPSQGLAPIIVDQIFDLIPRLTQEGVQVLLVEQDVGRGLEVSEQAVVIEKGRATLSGPSRELLADPRVRESFLGLS
ncbi:ABC transporter ATP-binding protein [Azospirillum canadense]|uniref:ABC transporter ATP-binding protein n=1 Tax=Azospirillum canadense TaxID=403962 RepID=UPI0022278E4C|nr:ABC transporter ATP-binding protein [Azospirillum canadense]MCW2241375.1 branched-chain amino acid transport system ATP-binding protein [Azospirillum canadense]